jgi:putative acetyltransferase
VAREWRGQGIGTRLLESAIQWARETGVVTRIELFVFARNTRAIRLYERFGFVIEGRRHRSVYEDGQYMDDLLMALLL